MVFIAAKIALTHFKFTAELPDYEAERADFEYHDLKNRGET